MQEKKKRKLTILPKTKLGKLSLILIIIFFLLLIIGTTIASLQGPIPDQTFFSNPLLSIPMLAAFTSAIISFFTGLISIIKHKERSVLVFLVSIIGFLVSFFIVGEILVPH